jgi:hypothetical protein
MPAITYGAFVSAAIRRSASPPTSTRGRESRVAQPLLETQGGVGFDERRDLGRNFTHCASNFSTLDCAASATTRKRLRVARDHVERARRRSNRSEPEMQRAAGQQAITRRRPSHEPEHEDRHTGDEAVDAIEHAAVAGQPTARCPSRAVCRLSKLSARSPTIESADRSEREADASHVRARRNQTGRRRRPPTSDRPRAAAPPMHALPGLAGRHAAARA